MDFFVAKREPFQDQNYSVFMISLSLYSVRLAFITLYCIDSAHRVVLPFNIINEMTRILIEIRHKLYRHFKREEVLFPQNLSQKDSVDLLLVRAGDSRHVSFSASGGMTCLLYSMSLCVH